MTFSIVAHDPAQDAIGVAVQSKFVSVGSVVPFASADAGAIATQSFANVAYGPEGLEHLRNGLTAEETIEQLIETDEAAERRQVGVVGSDGSVAGYTGEECFDTAFDVQGEQYTAQGNILENEETVHAMAERFEETDGGLPERLIAALYAADEAGGDSRGKQSAALYVVKPDGGYDGKSDRWIDVRVDEHDEPIAELERVFKLYDVTLLSRAEPDELEMLTGDTAEEITGTLVSLDFLDEADAGDEAFGEAERAALEAFRGMNNFENHSLAVIEDALARGWPVAEGDGEDRMVDAIWHGLQRLDRK
jgi:uncharacterized Ntn-hydrolase superfamily protein